MIPKIIHYCWFGKGLIPQSQKECIKSWRKYCPDYRVICWNEQNFDVGWSPYTREAYKRKKWAFVSDVARIMALCEMGGIYMDTDVELMGSLDPYITDRAFSGIEIYPDFFEKTSGHLVDKDGRPINSVTDIEYCGFLSAVIGSEAHNPFFTELLSRYMNRKPYKDDGSFNYAVVDGLLADVAVQYGFRYRDELQDLGVIKLYPSSVFSYKGSTSQGGSHVAYHHNVASWIPKTRKEKFFIWLDCHGILLPYRRIKKQFLGWIR